MRKYQFSYRPEIDGLRFIAVLLVILYHSKINFFNGGFIGVDIFFVISGYLITSIIIKQNIENKFSYFNFIERRARRILPALFLVIFICLPFAYILLINEDLNKFGLSVVASTTYWSNFLFFFENLNYFAAASEYKPLLHTWSLSIEEQFYLLCRFEVLHPHQYGHLLGYILMRSYILHLIPYLQLRLYLIRLIFHQNLYLHT